ncbi:prostasin-like [Mercenaria mercenaria]|uniref:prostasin-like n=1 Tax=Mercenaria mercenaria TaxID=6596 RepID=UPI00234F3D63|nr:prostasin-like [Mercenaria mercenaria]
MYKTRAETVSMGMALVLIFCLYLLPQTSGLLFQDIGGIQCGTPMFQPASRQEVLGKRIVGGTEATPGSWPWMVMLKKNGIAKCGGSILDNQIVLTAAHCLFGETNLAAWSVYVGKHHKDIKDKTERHYAIKHFIPHEKFNKLTLMNDIALLLLKEPIIFTYYARPICLPLQNSPLTGQCFTTGWGETKGTGYDDVLKEIQLDPKKYALCLLLLKKIGKIPLRNIFCAGYQDADACYGDSGGPYSCKIKGRWYIKGIVSSGPDCGQPGWSGIYVNVSRYISWIKKRIAIAKASLAI